MPADSTPGNLAMLGSNGADVLADLPERMEPARAAPLYRVGLALVALVMVLLPLTYVALIVAVAALIYLHAVHNAWLIDDFSGLLPALAYFGPMVAGAIALFFMVKPFLARRPEGPQPLRLAAEDEPLLFAFIARIGALVGAPMPAVVHVDCDVNASASFRRGWISLLGGDLTLTIGLPLAAGLTQCQLAGVLAHELGHFAQGAGMRLTYVIRSINGWFARVVYERDAWDAWLDQAARESDVRIAAVLQVARLAVRLTRRILWMLMMVGHAVSSFMLRQMELDADRYEVKLAGSAAYGPTLRRLRVLSVAARAALDDLRAGWQERRLPDNLPLFIVHKGEALPVDVLQRIEQVTAGARTGLFDSHPADSDRVRAAERAGEPGLFLRAEPATELFNDFAALARALTRHHYEHAEALPVHDVDLVPVDEMIRESEANEAGLQAIDRYYQGGLARMGTVLISAAELAPSAEPEETVRRLATARDAMRAGAPDAAARARRILELDQSAVDATVALRLCEAGFRVRPERFGLIEGTAHDAAERLKMIAGQRRAITGQCTGWETEARLRLVLALQLLVAAGAEGRAATVALAAEAATLVRLLATEPATSGPLRRLGREYMAFNILAGNLQGQVLTPQAGTTLDQITARIRDLTGQIQAATSDLPYPFTHARGAITVAEFARSDEPADNDVVRTVRNAQVHLERLPALYERALGRLVWIAEQVEATVLDKAADAAADEGSAPAPG